MSFPLLYDSDSNSESADSIEIHDDEPTNTLPQTSIMLISPVVKSDIEELLEKIIKASCDKTKSLFSVIYLLHEHCDHCIDATPAKLLELRQELLTAIKAQQISNARYKLIETILNNFFI